MMASRPVKEVRLRAMRNLTLIIGIMLAGAFTYAHAQWVNYPDARIPRTKDGKPNLTAPAPRLNGKPDVSGLWQAERRPASEYDSVLGKGFSALQVDTHDITPNVLNVFWGIRPEEEPLRPEAAAIQAPNAKSAGVSAHSVSPGWHPPRASSFHLQDHSNAPGDHAVV